MNCVEKSCEGCLTPNRFKSLCQECSRNKQDYYSRFERDVAEFEPKPSRPEVPRGIFCWSTEISEDLANRRLVMLAEKINEILYYITSLYRELDEMKEGKK